MIIDNVTKSALIASKAAPGSSIVASPVVDNVVAEIDHIGTGYQRIAPAVVCKEAMVNRYGELFVSGPAADEDAHTMGTLCVPFRCPFRDNIPL